MSSAFDLPAEAKLKNSPEKAFGWRSYLFLLRFSVVLIVVPFFGYSRLLATSADEQQAVQLETQLHQQMARGDSDGIYNNADQEFTDKVTRAYHERYFAYIASKYGSPTSCDPSHTGVRIRFGSRTIQSKCTTQFSSGATAIETFRWKKTGDDYHLTFYSLRPE